MKIQAHVFTNRELSLIQKAVFTYICQYEESQEKNGESTDKATARFYKKEYEEMKALYQTL